jgi:hypothetical protein
MKDDMPTPNKIKKFADEQGVPADAAVLKVLNEEMTLQKAAHVIGVAEANLSRWASKNGIEKQTVVAWVKKDG